MPPIPYQDITEMVQQKQYISLQEKTFFPIPASMVSRCRAGAEVNSFQGFLHIRALF